MHLDDFYMLDRTRFESLSAELMGQQFQRVPKMREFHVGEWTARDYHIRRVAETVLRIRLNNEVDTDALFRIGSSNDALAANLANDHSLRPRCEYRHRENVNGFTDLAY